jgi:hypothetical protein
VHLFVTRLVRSIASTSLQWYVRAAEALCIGSGMLLISLPSSFRTRIRSLAAVR